MGFGNVFKKALGFVWLKKRDFDPKKLDTKDILLPEVIIQYSQITILKMVKEELKTFKFLDYKNKTQETLEQHSYHSLQIGILLRAIQLDLDLLVPNLEAIFPNSIIKLTKSALEVKIFDIVEKYNQHIPKNIAQLQLETDIEWTPLEAAYLLYYLAINKK